MKLPENVVPVLIGIVFLIVIWGALFGFSINGFIVFCAFAGFLWVYNTTNIFHSHDADDE